MEMEPWAPAAEADPGQWRWAECERWCCSPVPLSPSDIKQEALAADRTCERPPRASDWNLATGPNSCFEQKTSAYFRFVFHKLTPQPAKNLCTGVRRLVYN